jgi:hypothetical protein
MNAQDLKTKVIENCRWNIDELEREKLRIEGKLEAFYAIKNLIVIQNIGGENEQD